MKPQLEIPVSSVRNPQETIFELIYDDPYQKEHEKDGRTWTSYTYTVIPEGSAEEHIMFGTTGLYNALQRVGAVAGTKVSVIKTGTGKDTRWHVEHVGGAQVNKDKPEPRTSSSLANGRGIKEIPIAWKPYTEGEVDIMVEIMKNRLRLYKTAYAIVNSDETLMELPEEIKSSLATSLSITAEKVWRPGMTIATEEKDFDFINSVSKRIEDGDDTVRVVMETAVMGLKNVTTGDLIPILSAIGTSSDHIKDGDENMWKMVRDIAVEYDSLGGLTTDDEQHEATLTYFREKYATSVRQQTLAF